VGQRRPSGFQQPGGPLLSFWTLASLRVDQGAAVDAVGEKGTGVWGVESVAHLRVSTSSSTTSIVRTSVAASSATSIASSELAIVYSQVTARSLARVHGNSCACIGPIVIPKLELTRSRVSQIRSLLV